VGIWDWRAKKEPRTVPPPPAVKSPAGDRRESVRFPADLKVVFQPISLVPLMQLPARVRDVSTTGIGLLCATPVPPGTFVVIDFKQPNRTSAPKLVARIVRLVPMNETIWLLGCNFSKELSQADLQALLA